MGSSRASTVRRIARTARLAALGAATAITICSLAGVAGARLAQAVDRPAAWSIAACDIGQGDAVLVSSNGAHALVDTGPDPARLTGCLNDLGIARIDLLVLTHYDLDHVGGTQAVIGKVSVAMVGPPIFLSISACHVSVKALTQASELIVALPFASTTSQPYCWRIGQYCWAYQ